MKRYVINSLLVMTSLFALVILKSCSKEEEFEGPSLIDLYGEFSVLEEFAVSDAEVDFASGETTYFTAQFSKNVNWTLTITGNISGAQKVITGFSNALNSQNARWNGTTTALPMFGVEECTATLSIENEPESFSLALSTLTSRVYPGLLLADFEDGFPEGWTTFVQSGANMSFVVSDEEPAGQGNQYYDMGGTVNWDYLIGLVDIPGEVYNSEPTFPLSSNPDNVYFNVLLYNPPAITNAITLFQFREDDNGDGVYSNNEDMWSIEVTGLEEGWHKVAQQYDEIPTLVNGAPSNPLGNGLHEPNKLLKLSVLFLANPTSGYSQTYMDFLIFTENAELQP